MSRRWIAGFAVYVGACASASIVAHHQESIGWAAFFLFWAVTIGLLVMKVEQHD